MTFFANSGVRFPNLEGPTREAGTRALGGAADLWRLFALIEGRTDGSQDHEAEVLRRCVENLTMSSAMYQSVLGSIRPDDVRLSAAEIELAGLSSDPSLAESPYGRPESAYGRPWNLAQLYIALIHGLEILMKQLEGFDLHREKASLAQPVFSMMRQWENISRIGRVIAVVNRRN